MEGADKTASSFFAHWKAIILLGLILGVTFSVYRWSNLMMATVDIWSLEQQKKAAVMAKEAASAQAEKAKFAEAIKVATSAQAEKAKPEDACKLKSEMKPKAYYLSERYWVCIHKVVNCVFNTDGNQYDPNNVVRCAPAYSTIGGGFGKPSCPEGDYTQTTFVLKMKSGPEKVFVPNDVYGKHEPGTWVFLMCDELRCDPEIVDPPPPEPSASTTPASSS